MKRSHHPGWGIDSDHQEKRLQSHSERDGEGIRYPVVLLISSCTSFDSKCRSIATAERNGAGGSNLTEMKV